jgi:hypothetical protein
MTKSVKTGANEWDVWKDGVLIGRIVKRYRPNHINAGGGLNVTWYAKPVSGPSIPVANRKQGIQILGG